MGTDALIGSVLGNYQVEGRIGRGGMGIVYRASDLTLQRPVALKVLPAEALDDATARARFQREIRTAVAIEHPNIVPVYEAGYEEGRFFIAMRLIDGTDLAAVIAGVPLELARSEALFAHVASGLAHVHRQGHVHRDVKPHNVLIAQPGDPDEYAVLTDFGIARARDSSTALTKGILGTAAYMAPEILEWKPAVPASDQYSLGCVLFEMLTGRPPYYDKELPAAHLHEPVPSLRETAPHLPPALGDALSRALAKSPEERFPSVRDLAAAVREATSVGRHATVQEQREPIADSRQLGADSPPHSRGRMDAGIESRPSGSLNEPRAEIESFLPAGTGHHPNRGPLRPSLWQTVAWHLWMVWAILPFFNGLAWVHAGLLTRRRRHFVYAAAYLSIFLAAVLETEIMGKAETSTALAVVAVVAWIGGMVHVAVERRAVVRGISERSERQN